MKVKTAIALFLSLLLVACGGGDPEDEGCQITKDKQQSSCPIMK